MPILSKPFLFCEVCGTMTDQANPICPTCRRYVHDHLIPPAAAASVQRRLRAQGYDRLDHPVFPAKIPLIDPFPATFHLQPSPWQEITRADGGFATEEEFAVPPEEDEDG